MRSRLSLRQWTARLLPAANSGTQAAAAQLLRALLVGFTTSKAQLARQLDRASTGKSARQWLDRVLERPALAPTHLYAHLLSLLPLAVKASARAPVPLLLDLTFFAEQWVVLQVSIPWERRALPLLRITQPYQGPERSQATAVATALAWLETHLPEAKSRYVLVMDRGFPGHAFLNQLREARWRFVIRVEGRWRVEHADFKGSLLDLPAVCAVTAVPGILRGAQLGERGRGPKRSSQAHVVYYRGVGYAANWYLVTSETDPTLAVTLYRQRMQIEQEFRDLKGYWGLDHLAEWVDQDQVARFLAWLAVYEWRLAHLWVTYRLVDQQATFQVGGKLSWIRTVREWLARQFRSLNLLPDLRL
jgi:hypothetical protein